VLYSNLIELYLMFSLVEKKTGESTEAASGRAFNNQQQSFYFNPNTGYQSNAPQYQTSYSEQHRPPLRKLIIFFVSVYLLLNPTNNLNFRY
jgi:hypothetical protein